MLNNFKKHIDKFVQISNDEFDEIQKFFDFKNVAKKENLLEEGQICRYHFFVLDGLLRKFYINERVDWMAVFEPKGSQFAVSRLLTAPEQGEHIAMLWNVPSSYRKFYLKCFASSPVPAGFTGTWRMVTAFGASSAEKWEPAARKLATELRDR